MVTALALRMGRLSGMGRDQLQFIEEASMLHDIGIVRTDAPGIGCKGSQPYIAHVEEGRKILEAEGLPAHAQVAATHVGLGGLSAEDIRAQQLPLPQRDFLSHTDEERIISLADLFFSKNPQKLFATKKLEKVRRKLYERSPKLGRRLDEWAIRFHLREALPTSALDVAANTST